MTAMTLRVARATLLNPLIRELELVRPEGGTLPGFEAGAHVRVQVRLPDGGTDWRPYSLVALDAAAAAAPQRYVIAVRREAEGRGGSRFMHEGLREGELIAVEPPKHDFALQPGTGRVVLLAGGIGVTPVASMAAQALASGREVVMTYAGRSRDLMAYLAPLQALLGERLSVHADDEQGGAPLDVDAVLAGCGAADVVHVCGPQALLDQVLARAEARGWARERVRFELFAAPAAEAGDAPFEVELAQSGKTFTVGARQTLLEALTAHGCDPLFDCQRGECGVCAVPVMSGDIEHRDHVLTAREKAEGRVIQVCVSRARGRLVLDL